MKCPTGRSRPRGIGRYRIMAFLTIAIDREVAGRRELTGPLVIGRSEECDLCIPSPLLSRKHLELQPTPQGWLAIDLGSKNGSLIGENKLTRELLQDGSILSLGNVLLKFNTAMF